MIRVNICPSTAQLYIAYDLDYNTSRYDPAVLSSLGIAVADRNISSADGTRHSAALLGTRGALTLVRAVIKHDIVVRSVQLAQW